MTKAVKKVDDKILGQIRHVLTLVAGVLITLGVVDNDFGTQTIDVLMSLAGAVLMAIAHFSSWKSKVNAQKDKDDAVRVALYTPVPDFDFTGF